MKRIYRILSLLLLLAVFALGSMSGLGEDAGDGLPQLDDAFTERDLSGNWDPSATLISLEGDTAVTASHVVSVDGGTITVMDGGVYVLSGTLDEGQVIVDVKDDEKVQLVLDGASITSSESAAIRVVQADKVFITLAPGTENLLANGGSFAEEGVEAVIWSDEDLTFNGTGTLVIDSPAGSGIDGKDDVKFASGVYVITAAKRGVDANDSIRIAGGSFTVTTDGTAFRANHSSNEALGYITIWGGDFNIVTGGGAVNGASASNDTPFGFPGVGTDNGFGPRDFSEREPGELTENSMPMRTGEDGEFPTPPDFSGEDGTPPTPPEGMEADFQPGQGGFPIEAAEEEFGEESEENAAASKGFKASGDITVIGGSFRLDTAEDAFHADGDLLVFDGEINIASGDDGLHADGELTMVGGTVNITLSSEGLEAEVIAITGGSIALVSSDDGLNARSSSGVKESFDAQEGVRIDISGGTLYVNASGDGIDSNGDIVISGGNIVVSGPDNSMNGALDYNGTAVISGGTIFAAGASGMAENFSDTSIQPAFLIGLEGNGGEIVVSDAAGNVLLTAEVEKAFQTVVISSPDLAVGETYVVSCGDASKEITLTETVTGSDASGMGFMNRFPLPDAREADGSEE